MIRSNSHVNSRKSLSSYQDTVRYLQNDNKYIKSVKIMAANIRNDIAEKSNSINQRVPNIITRAISKEKFELETIQHILKRPLA